MRLFIIIEKEAFLSAPGCLFPPFVIRVNFSFWLLVPVVAGEGVSPGANGWCFDLVAIGFAAPDEGFDVFFVEVEVVGSSVCVESCKERGSCGAAAACY